MTPKQKLLAILMYLAIPGFSQTDTAIVRNQSGFLFLSSYNYKYDEPLGHMKPIGFPDFFFPTSSFSSEVFSDSNVTINFKNGVRVEFLNNRNLLKSKATLFNCDDDNACYSYTNFYILPVSIAYKIYEDNWPLNCKSGFFYLKINGVNEVKFNFSHKAIIVQKVTLKQ